jgi:hypothetical protein
MSARRRKAHLVAGGALIVAFGKPEQALVEASL